MSELPFRMLCRKYGAELCYTPMYHSRLFAEEAKYRYGYHVSFFSLLFLHTRSAPHTHHTNTQQ
jgi:tRNA-dihydrouridine synthase